LSAARIVECIPNFSEGRDMAVVGALADAARGVPGAALLDYSSDADHNRSVFTLIGDPDGIADAAFFMCETAVARIDMTAHAGGHPRMGAADVVPLVPIRNISMAECVDLSVRLAKRINGDLGVPVFLYEESCTAESRRNLASIRRGEFEGMPGKLLLDGWAPDFGGRAIHPTAGVTAVGARAPLLAFNVNLDTPDLGIAKRIARAVRGSSGGFPFCKAIGVMLVDRNIAQVSMNIADCENAPIHRLFEAIRLEAGRLGVSIAASEIVGLAPARTLIGCAEFYLKIEDFDYDRQVLDNHLLRFI
jgi:glutamate formiminotransferase